MHTAHCTLHASRNTAAVQHQSTNAAMQQCSKAPKHQSKAMRRPIGQSSAAPADWPSLAPVDHPDPKQAHRHNRLPLALIRPSALARGRPIGPASGPRCQWGGQIGASSRVLLCLPPPLPLPFTIRWHDDDKTSPQRRPLAPSWPLWQAGGNLEAPNGRTNLSLSLSLLRQTGRPQLASQTPAD